MGDPQWHGGTDQPIDGLPPGYYAPPDHDHPYGRIRSGDEMAKLGVENDQYSEDIGQALTKYYEQAQYMEAAITTSFTTLTRNTRSDDG